MAENPRYEAIIVGAGMGGLSTAAFLAREGKTVVVLEKHDKPGGYVTSFTRGAYTFDTSIAHLNELGEGQTIERFVRYWGGSVSSLKLRFKLKYFIDGNEYLVDTADLPDSLVACFPSCKHAIERLFSITERIMREAAGSGPMKPPSDMTPVEKLAFGASALVRQPTIVRYGMKPAVRVLRALLHDAHLETIIWAFYPINSLSLLSETWGWEKMRRGEYYYPIGGMQAIPDAVVEAIRRHGGEVVLNTEVRRVIVEDGKAVGVECSNGAVLHADVVVANSPIHHTLFSLCAHVPEMEGLRKTVARRRVFVSTMALYLGIDESYDFRGVDYFFFLDSHTRDIPEKDLTPETCPILMMVPPAKPAGQRDRSVIVGAILPYEYANNWGTGDLRTSNPAYREVKERAKDTVLRRVCDRMGDAFAGSIKYVLAATPLTFERYTYNEKGSIMGWDSKDFGKFPRFETPVKNLYLVGQWVFPGGGVPAVMGSGYYVARRILEKEGIDLEARMNEFFRRTQV